MPRVTSLEVKEIIVTDLVTLDAFILSATVIVDQIEAGSSLSGAHLKEIERWLSAHFTALNSETAGRLTSEKAGDEYEAKFEGSLGKGFESTVFGQQALSLDTSGYLKSVGGSKLRARFEVI